MLDKLTAMPNDNRAQAGTVISVVVISVIAMIGVLIVGQVYEAIPLASINNTALNGSVDSVVEGTASAMDFIPIILLVLLASIVIAVVQRMRT